MISPDPSKHKTGLVGGSGGMEVYHRGHFAAIRKADLFPVTEADKHGHQVLAEGLREIAAMPMVSEESAALL